MHVAAAYRQIARHEPCEAYGAFLVVGGFRPGLNHILARICAVIHADGEGICFVGHCYGRNGGIVGIFCCRYACNGHVESHISVGVHCRESRLVHGIHAVDGICVAVECAGCVECLHVVVAQGVSVI